MSPLDSTVDFPTLGEDSGGFNQDASAEKGNSLGVSSQNPKIGKWRSLFGDKGSNDSSSNCKLPFHKPQSINGKLISVISPEDLVDELRVCDKFLVGYLVGRKLPFHIVKEAMDKAWKLKGNYRLTIHEESMYVFEFDLDEDRVIAVELGSVTILNSLFLIRPWQAFIEQDILEMKSVPVWMNLRNVPIHLWNEKGLGMIASVLGVPLIFDLHTLNRTRMRYARVCVEMEANSEFPDSIPVLYDGKEFNVSVEYTRKPPRCLDCVTFGHSSSKCPKVRKASKNIWIPKLNRTTNGGVDHKEDSQSIVKEVEIVDGTFELNGNNDLGRVSAPINGNMILGKDGVNMAIATFKEMEVIGTHSTIQVSELNEEPFKECRTYARKSKSSSKKSNKRKNSHICNLNPYSVLAADSEIEEPPKSSEQVSKMEETNSHVQGSLLGTEAISSKDDQGCEEEFQSEVAVVTCDDSTEESDKEDISMEKLKPVEEVSRWVPMTKQENMDKLAKFSSSLGVARGGKEAEVKNIFGSIVDRYHSTKLVKDLGPSNEDLGRGKRTPIPKKKL